MRTTRGVDLSTVAAIGLIVLLGGPHGAASRAAGPRRVSIGDTDLGGVVTGPNGPEAGVWVIAETTDLPTKFAKMVVTDDQGRYVLPELPKANYEVWVRGYGLVDSPKVDSRARQDPQSAPPCPRPTRRRRREYYPAIYWFSMLQDAGQERIPRHRRAAATAFRPRSAARRSGSTASRPTAASAAISSATRRRARSRRSSAQFDSSYSAWVRRIQSGQASETMARTIGRLDTQRALKLFRGLDRPHRRRRVAQGRSRSGRRASSATSSSRVWDWGSPKMYLHDEIATDRRNPTVNANGPIYGSPEWSTDHVPVLDPVKQHAPATSRCRCAIRRRRRRSTIRCSRASPYWGDETIWDSQTSPHNPMFDDKGRVWFTARIHGPHAVGVLPARARTIRRPSCSRSSAPARQLVDVRSEDAEVHAGRHLLQHPPPAVRCEEPAVGIERRRRQRQRRRGRLARSSTSSTRPATSRRRRAGRRSSSTPTATASATKAMSEPNQPVDPTKDKRVVAGFYGIAPSPGRRQRSGARCSASPARSCASIRATIPGDRARRKSTRCRCPAIRRAAWTSTRNGVVWVPLASGHMAQLRSPQVQGPAQRPDRDRQALPGRLDALSAARAAIRRRSARRRPAAPESSYYTWVDQHDTFGLGKDVPIATGNNSDSLHVLVDGKFIQLRVPYPMGFFAKGSTAASTIPTPAGRAAACGRPTATARRSIIEGGKGTKPKVVKFQLRPDPLAR